MICTGMGKAYRLMRSNSCRREARRLGVAGTVRNRGDGSVEARFEGPAPAVEQMIAWCHRGPRSSHVRGVEVAPEPPTGTTEFRISFSS